MASLSPPAPDLTTCTPYCATDPVLGHIVVFYNHAVSQTTSPISNRIEAHILSCAGFQTYPKLILTHSSPLYAAVNHLPLQKQSSELHRGLAIAVLKYFSELSKAVKETILRSKSNGAAPREGQAVAFDEMHAGDLAARLKEVESDSLAHDLICAMSERFVGSVDLDIVVRSQEPGAPEITPESIPEEVEKFLDRFGEPSYLPFTKLKRSASKPASAQTRPRSLQDTAEALNRELDELRYTEENYVAKLRELLEDTVKPLKQRRPSSRKGEGSALSPKELDILFPPCLEAIIEVNSQFLERIRDSGIEEFSKCCLEMFPTFKKPYEEYMQASAEFPQLLAKLTKHKDSSVSKRVQQTGEQRLRSLIIEPVQRLPRYSLLIDNMVNILPPEHHSLKHLNAARDVITEICSLQSSESTERTTTVKRLQTIIASWPVLLHPTGRLITAVDFFDILPPFNDNTSEAISSILLLFPDCVAILRRPSSRSMLARGIMAEVDRPGGGISIASGSAARREGGGHDLQFLGWIDIMDIRLASSDSGTVLWMTLSSNLKDGWDVRGGGTSLRKMRLLNQYEGRAYKVEEEFVKARLERRMGRKTKGVVGLREGKYEGLTLWSCVWGSQEVYAAEKRKGSTVVYLDIGSTGSNTARSQLMSEVGKDCVDIVFSLEEVKAKQLRLECRSWNEYSSTDTVQHEELLPAFAMRLSSLLRLHASPQHPPLTSALLSANRKLMRSLGAFESEGRFGKLRAPSPVKLINSILNTPGSPSKSARAGLLDRTQSQILPLRPERPISMLHRGSTALGLVDDEESQDGGTRHKIIMPTESPLRKLEDTFEAFVNAIRMIGSSGLDLRPLHEIYKVDNDAVEMFLDQLITDPRSVRIEQDTGIDVVYVAFARFLSEDWREGMGPVVSESALQELQRKSETLHPGDFEDFFRIFVLDWTPQNKRAFRTLIVLLREMQEKVEDEDDMGILTKAFTELLVGTEVNALDYMGLVDMFVGDMNTLFSEAPPPQLENGAVKRAKSMNTPNQSSLRKRLGLTHTSSMRDPYRSDKDKAQSVWRTLSKRDKDNAKTRMERSKSIDNSARPKIELPPPVPLLPPGPRPPSRDRFNSGRPIVVGAGPATPIQAMRPLSTVMLASPINLASPEPLNPRRKRRSSLSDLTNHPEYRPLIPAKDKPPVGSNVEEIDDIPPPPPPHSSTPPLRLSHSPTPPLYPTPPLHPTPPLYPTPPLNPTPPLQPILPLQPTPPPYPPPIYTDPQRLDPPHGDRSGKDSPPSSLSRHPTMRKSFGASTAVPVSQRLKMQSTQKLRERLNNEKQALSTAAVDSSLQREIDLIGAELNSAMNLSSSSLRTRTTPSQTLQAEKLRDLSLRLLAVEARVSLLSSSNANSAEVEKLKVQLSKKEKELEDVDKLLNDCVAENDVMFERFNEELVKMSNGFKLGKGEAEVLEMLKVVREEQARLKRENM
ncbi:RhoGEF domain-containing protein [Sphaerosporella brunnea]|uniref:RhoGEF domain-containing protein n=1 Tax=Sphaerosporella brunnea TaxID=1250544 RepID=A0A5J5EVQ5_9PEZI|nr:RhoGEF domain-containing protein [Sphaerosporella brunnea]